MKVVPFAWAWHWRKMLYYAIKKSRTFISTLTAYVREDDWSFVELNWTESRNPFKFLLNQRWDLRQTSNRWGLNLLYPLFGSFSDPNADTLWIFIVLIPPTLSYWVSRMARGRAMHVNRFILCEFWLHSIQKEEINRWWMKLKWTPPLSERVTLKTGKTVTARHILAVKLKSCFLINY